MSRRIKIPVVAVYCDGGDGGGNFDVYQDKEHYLAESVNKWTTKEDAEERWVKAESGDDPYTYGEVVHTELVLSEENGVLTLAKPLHLHWGQ